MSQSSASQTALLASSMPEGSWGEGYAMMYAYHAHANRAARRRTRALGPWQEADATSAVPAETKLAEPDLLAGVQSCPAIKNSRQRLIDMRLNIGYVWQGGPVAGCAQYMQAPLVYRGLASTGEPILELFVTKTHRAGRLRTGHDKAGSEGCDSKLLALDCCYVESNKTVRGVLRVELDTIWPGWPALEAALMEAGIPLPNVCVGYQDCRGHVWRPHLIWMLADGVSFSDKTSKRARGAWNGALRALVGACLPLGADVGGLSNPHRHKNPLSPLWSRRITHGVPYVLRNKEEQEGGVGALARSLFGTRTRFAALLDLLPDRENTAAALRAAQAVQEGVGQAWYPDHPDAGVAASSNALWRGLGRLARTLVAQHRDTAGSRGEYDRLMLDAALANLVETGPGRVRAIERLAYLARYVGDWHWINWRARRPLYDTSPLGIELKQARIRGARSQAAQTKTKETLALLVRAAQRLCVDATQPTQQAVATAAGRCRRTVQAYWSQVLESLASMIRAKQTLHEVAASTCRSVEIGTGQGATGPAKDKKLGMAGTGMAALGSLPLSLPPEPPHETPDPGTPTGKSAIQGVPSSPCTPASPCDPALPDSQEVNSDLVEVRSPNPILENLCVPDQPGPVQVHCDPGIPATTLSIRAHATHVIKRLPVPEFMRRKSLPVERHLRPARSCRQFGLTD